MKWIKPVLGMAGLGVLFLSQLSHAEWQLRSNQGRLSTANPELELIYSRNQRDPQGFRAEVFWAKFIKGGGVFFVEVNKHPVGFQSYQEDQILEKMKKELTEKWYFSSIHNDYITDHTRFPYKSWSLKAYQNEKETLADFVDWIFLKGNSSGLEEFQIPEEYRFEIYRFLDIPEEVRPTKKISDILNQLKQDIENSIKHARSQTEALQDPKETKVVNEKIKRLESSLSQIPLENVELIYKEP